MPFDPFSAYTDFIANVLRQIHIEPTSAGFKIRFGESDESSIDKRIERLDQAREYLSEGLLAIDELRKSAEENKKEMQHAIAQLALLSDNKQKLEASLQSIREVASADVQTFRELAGIPSRATIRRERIIGFFSGVVASMVASGLVYALVHFLTNTTAFK
jgi:hypothetical protein